MEIKVLSEYDVQAAGFVKLTGIEINRVYTGHRKHFDTDKDKRSCWHITVVRGDKSFSYNFGQSTMESYEVRDHGASRWHAMKQNDIMRADVKHAMRAIAGHCGDLVRECQTPPSNYSLLSCMASDSYETETFEYWCDNFGYDTDSRKALDTYLKCEKISADICRLFTSDELDQLREIQ
jgi:hypothetical protein